MCDLCNPETRTKARESLRSAADALERLANDLRDLAEGRVEPHGIPASGIGALARGIVRKLVQEWV